MWKVEKNSEKDYLKEHRKVTLSEKLDPNLPNNSKKIFFKTKHCSFNFFNLMSDI